MTIGNQFKFLTMSLMTTLFLISCDEPGDIIFKNKGFETGADVAQLKDGNYFELGTALGSDEVSNFMLVKFDQTGKILWNKTYGGASYEDAYAMKATPDGGAVLAGNTSSFGPGIDNDIWNMWLVKVDANGNKQWDSAIGSLQHDGAKDVIVLNDGYMVVGYTHDETNPGIGVYKLDLNGKLVWSKNYGHGIGQAITQTNDENFVIVAPSILTMYDIATDIYMIKINSNGDILWERTLGTNCHDDPTDIIELNDGSLVISGNQKKNDGVSNLLGLTIKTDANGNQLWFNELSLTSDGAVTKLARAADGNIVMVGDRCTDGWYNDFWVVKFGLNGEQLWNKTHGTGMTDKAAGLLIDSTGDIIIGGHTLTDVNSYKFDLYAMRLDANGDM